MNVNKRVHRDNGVRRDAGQRTPRSGGRTVAQRTTRGGTGAAVTARNDRVRAIRDFPTQGSAALAPERIEDERAIRVWDSTGEPDQGRGSKPESRAAVRGPRLKVAPPPPVAGPKVPFVALVLAVVVGGVLGILLVQTRVNQNAFELARLQDQQAALDVEQQRLEKEIAMHEAPGNLAAQARKLGLVKSGPPAFIRLPDGKVIGVPQPAQGQRAITSQQGG